MKHGRCSNIHRIVNSQMPHWANNTKHVTLFSTIHNLHFIWNWLYWLLKKITNIGLWITMPEIKLLLYLNYQIVANKNWRSLNTERELGINKSFIQNVWSVYIQIKVYFFCQKFQ